MLDVLSYIRSLVFTQPETRKRRSTLEDCENPINSKIRRLTGPHMSNVLEDDLTSTSLLNSVKPRYRMRSSSPDSKLHQNWSKENVTVTIGDDDENDDILEVRKLKPLKPSGRPCVTSTPHSSRMMTSSRNGYDDDIIYLGQSQPSVKKKLESKRHGFEYIKPSTYLTEMQIKREALQNGSSNRELSSPIWSSVREIKNKLGLRKQPVHSALLEQSFRLDEKAKFKRLLSQQSGSTNLCNSFAKYNTLDGKLFTSSMLSRGKKLAIAGKHKSTPIIDLTQNGTQCTRKTRLSTKDTIEKVLNHFDNSETIVLKDSDSEVEVLPSPPSPKPDIQVERVNSLKTIIDTKEHTHEKWLKNIYFSNRFQNFRIQQHRDDMAKYEHQIKVQTEQMKKLNLVTKEVVTQRLENQIARCLSIKDAILPELPDESELPELTEEDEKRINAAFGGKDVNEVLVKKFNLNITRRDILTLSGLNWLNDEVINFYMNLLIERGKSKKWPSVYATNTFFYPKLLKDGPSSLRRWTRRIDIFAHDLMVIPIHLNVHWCMTIVDFRNKTIRYHDSMGGSNKQCLEAILKYLQAEHLDKKHKDFDTSEWCLDSLDDIPQQMNGSDCGMFACTFAEFACRDSRYTFGQSDMQYLRRKMVLEILRGELLIQ